MNILDKTGLKEKDFLKKLNLEQFSSDEMLGEPTALKEVISYKIPPVLLLKSDTAGINLRSSANLEHSLQLFNETEDKDKDGVLGGKENKKTLLKLNTNTPVLKHALMFGVTADASTKYKGLDIGIETGATLRTLAYFKHAKNDKVKDAVLKDFKQMSFAFVLADVKKLNLGEALAVVTKGNLLFSLSFETTDFMAGGLEGITEFVKRGEDVLIDIDAGAEIGVEFSINGNYELVFSRVSSSGFAVEVKSAVMSELNASAMVGVSAAFSDPKVVSGYLEKQLDKILQAVTNMDIEELTALEQKLKNASAENLSIINLGENEQKAVEFLITRLKLKDEVNKITGLLNKIGEIREQIKSKITEAAKTKIEAGFNYEYSRITSNSTLLKATLDADILAKTHKDLILFNTSSLINLALKTDDNKKISIKEYLKERRIKTINSWGISLGIGNFKIGSKNSKEIETKEQTTYINKEKVKKVAFEGIKKYEEAGNLGGFGKDYWVAFNASMDTFKKEPTVSDFDFGFSFFLDHTEGTLRDSEREKFLQMMDMAKLWNIISESNADKRIDELWKLLNRKNDARDIRFSYRLNFTSDAFEFLKSDFTNLLINQKDKNLRLLSQAFGKAMPFSDNSKYRKDIQLRGEAYGELWNYYFQNEGFDGPAKEAGFRAYSILAEDYFKNKDSDLGRLEGTYDSPQQAGNNLWFGGIIRINNPAEKVKRFMNGLENLLFAIQSNDRKYEKVIKRVFREMQGAWSYQFCIKALGIYFIDLARIKGILDKVESHLEIRYTDKDKQEKTILLKKKD
jgi:preprotein translocase subunit YajC